MNCMQGTYFTLAFSFWPSHLSIVQISESVLKYEVGKEQWSIPPPSVQKFSELKQVHLPSVIKARKAKLFCVVHYWKVIIKLNKSL